MSIGLQVCLLDISVEVSDDPMKKPHPRAHLSFEVYLVASTTCLTGLSDRPALREALPAIPTSADLRRNPTGGIDGVVPLHTWQSKALCLSHGKGRKVEGGTGGAGLTTKRGAGRLQPGSNAPGKALKYYDG